MRGWTRFYEVRPLRGQGVLGLPPIEQTCPQLFRRSADDGGRVRRTRTLAIAGVSTFGFVVRASQAKACKRHTKSKAETRHRFYFSKLKIRIRDKVLKRLYTVLHDTLYGDGNILLHTDIPHDTST